MHVRTDAPANFGESASKYIFTVTLRDNGTWKELDKFFENASGVGLRGNGPGAGMRFSGFIGKMNRKNFSITLGRDLETGQRDIAVSRLDTTRLKEWVRGYLTHHGWKKAGLFGR